MTAAAVVVVAVAVVVFVVVVVVVIVVSIFVCRFQSILPCLAPTSLGGVSKREAEMPPILSDRIQ